MKIFFIASLLLGLCVPAIGFTEENKMTISVEEIDSQLANLNTHSEAGSVIRSGPGVLKRKKHPHRRNNTYENLELKQSEALNIPNSEN